MVNHIQNHLNVSNLYFFIRGLLLPCSVCGEITHFSYDLKSIR